MFTVGAEGFIIIELYSIPLASPGMKASPRFRESVANIRLRHQPSHIKYPLVSLHIVSNPDAYQARHLNVKPEVQDRDRCSLCRLCF